MLVIEAVGSKKINEKEGSLEKEEMFGVHGEGENKGRKKRVVLFRRLSEEDTLIKRTIESIYKPTR